MSENVNDQHAANAITGAASPAPEKKWTWATWCSLALFAGIITLFFILNRLQPLSADDYAYSFIYPDVFSPPYDVFERVDSFADVLRSQWNEWWVWNGRVLTNGLAQYFLMYDKLWFDIANTLAFAALTFALLRLTADRKLPAHWIVPTIPAIILLSIPVANEALFWLDGSCNNLWVLLVICLFLLAFFSENRRVRLLALILAPLAGNAHEGMSIGLIGFLFAYSLFTRKRKKGSIYYTTLALLLAGFAFRMVSPGLFIRLSIFMPAESDTASLIDSFIANTKAFIHLLFISKVRTLSILSVVILALGLGIYRFRKNRTVDERSMRATCLLIGAALQAIALIVVGGMWSRAWIGVYFYLLLAALTLLIPLLQNKSRTWGAGVAILSSCLALAMLFQAIPAARLHHELFLQRIEELKGSPRLIDNVLENCLQEHGIDLAKQRYVKLSLARNNCLINKGFAVYHGVQPFSELTRNERTLVESIEREYGEQLNDRDVIFLPNGLLLMSVPETIIDIRPMAFEEGGKAGRKTDPQIAWPLGRRFAMLIRLQPEDSSLSFLYINQNGERQTFELTTEQLQVLRLGGYLPAGQVPFP